LAHAINKKTLPHRAGPVLFTNNKRQALPELSWDNNSGGLGGGDFHFLRSV
jgi:hypothetical protein